MGLIASVTAVLAQLATMKQGDRRAKRGGGGVLRFAPALPWKLFRFDTYPSTALEGGPPPLQAGEVCLNIDAWFVSTNPDLSIRQ